MLSETKLRFLCDVRTSELRSRTRPNYDDWLCLRKVVQFVLILEDITDSHNFSWLAMLAAFFYLCN